jgi:biofilm PGA synthesis protein PgaA
VNIQLQIAALVLHNGLIKKAVKYYTSIIERFPDNFEAHYRLAGIFFNNQEVEKSLKHLETALSKRPDHFDALFLRGKILDHRGKYWESVKNYEQVLRYYPENKAARNLKYRALMDVGAATLVTEVAAEEVGGIDEIIAVRAQGDRAMQHLHWEEPKVALEKFDQVIEDYATKPLSLNEAGEQLIKGSQDIERESYLRARWDRVIALRRVENMEEIITEYLKAKEEGLDIPLWVREAAADAYLYVEEPQLALDIYEDILEKNPKSYNARFAKYYTLIELGRFDEATTLLEELDRDTPKDTTERGVINDNWKKADIAFSKAWLLMYQDRLKEAEEYLKDVQNVSPANTHLRTAEAHNHLWRGWPRRALEDFRIVRTMSPRHVGGQIGYAQALNENMYKKESRGHIHDVLEQYPKNKHARKVKRLFDIEDMTLLTTEAQFMEEFPGEDEFQFTLRLDEPVTHHHTLWGYWLRRETTASAGNAITGRTYAGDRWRPNKTWQLTGGLSFDHESDEDVGYLADLAYTPDDYWRFGAGYETQIISIPLRSRSAGVSANELSLSSAFRLNEGFNTTFNFAYVDFTDGNENYNYLWKTDTALTTRAYWKTRLGTEFGRSSSSRQDVDYFSPEQVYSLYFVPMVEHVWFRRYERGFVDRLFVGFGSNWQKDFGGRSLNFIRYEQDYKFSETKHWLIGARYDLKQYDDNDVNTFNLYTTLRLNF